MKITLDQDLKIGDSIIRKEIHTVRRIILLGTADLKAHAEMVLYAAGKLTTLIKSLKCVHLYNVELYHKRIMQFPFEVLFHLMSAMIEKKCGKLQVQF